MTLQQGVAVIGSGFIGKNLQIVFAERGVQVFAYDKNGQKGGGADPFNAQSIGELAEHCEHQENFTGCFFIAVPTPMLPSGECDTSIVESVLKELANAPHGDYSMYDRIAVVRSTVPPGSCARWNEMFKNKLHVVHQPEFLREATALEDTRNPDRIVLGGPVGATDRVEDILEEVFKGVPIVKVDSTTSEMIKYVGNCYLASKISFFNEMYQICSKLNIDYNEMVSIVKLDRRIGESHMQVPSFEKDDNGKPLFGFSLSCFPKDINALVYIAKKLGVIPTMLEATWRKNLEVRPSRDWEKLKGRAVAAKLVKPGRFPMPNIPAMLERVGKPLLTRIGINQ